jgi:spore germination protein GerM
MDRDTRGKETFMKRKRKKKRWIGKAFVFLLVAAAGLSILFFFRQEIDQLLKPKFEKPISPKEKKGVVLYFSDGEGEYLIGEKREIVRKGPVEKEATEMIAELLKGPRGELLPTLPPQTKLLALQLNADGVAKVDFSQSLSRNHPGGSSAEVITVYSIVNSLILNFPEIKRVQILIEGKEVETLTGHLALKRPISSKPDLIKR